MQGRTLDIISILILATFGLLAFFMRGVVQKYAPAGYLVVFFLCFLANASVLLPAPSVLVVVQYALILNPMLTAVCGSLGASLGEMIGFLTGAHGGNLLPSRFRNKILSVMPKYPYLVVFCVSVIPLPIFDIIGLISGAMRLNRAKFFACCLLGKLIKMVSFAGTASYLLRFLD